MIIPAIKKIGLALLCITAGVICLQQCSTTPAAQKFEGMYGAYLKNEGGKLAFPLHISMANDSLRAFITNGSDTSHFNSIRVDGDSLILGFDYYNSYLKAQLRDDGKLTGMWTKETTGGDWESLPFYAQKDTSFRRAATQTSTGHIDGNWQTTFTDNDGSFPAFGKFTSESKGHLYGTFETETGDYRFLEGYINNSKLYLSTFDGAHAFLFTGSVQSDSTITGNFWSGESYHATWKAHKGESTLRDPLQISADQTVGQTASFSFKDLQGNKVSASDAQFKNNPMLIYLFGSWCPNCADEAKMIRTLYKEKYKNTPLKIVGLAYEFTGKYEQDSKMVGRYKKRFSIPWTLLVAGTNNKAKAAETLPFLKDVVSFPTSIFADKNHKIQAIHVGFNGPATGQAYSKEIQRFKNHINEIIQ